MVRRNIKITKQLIVVLLLRTQSLYYFGLTRLYCLNAVYGSITISPSEHKQSLIAVFYSGKTIAFTLLNWLEDHKISTDAIQVLGSDGTSVNTGYEVSNSIQNNPGIAQSREE